MKKRRFFGSLVICAAICGLVIASDPTASAEPMTLEQSVRYALEHNPAVGTAKESIRKADAMVDEAFSAGMPKLNVTGTYTRLDQVSTVEFGPESVALNSLDSKSADLMLTQPIDFFGVISTSRHAAKKGKLGYVYDYERVVNDTTLAVATSYYAVLRAQQFTEVQEAQVQQLEAHLNQTKSHLKVGTAAPFDVLRAETEVANARHGLIAARNGVELAKAAFNNTIGRDPAEPVELAEPEQPLYPVPSLVQCLELAAAARPELLMIEAQQGLTDDMLYIARQGNKPQVNFTWLMTQNFTTTVFNPRDNSWRALATVSMPLYDGGKAKADVDKARSDAVAADLAHEQALLGVKLDVRQAYLEVNESREKIAVAEKALAQAREAMRLADVRFESGVSTQLEIFDARAALTVAETNHVSSVYDHHIALAHLDKAVGGPAQMEKLVGGGQ